MPLRLPLRAVVFTLAFLSSAFRDGADGFLKECGIFHASLALSLHSPMNSKPLSISSPIRRCIVLLLLLLPVTASAHSETGSVGGFISGFLHPITGLDHIVAMVAVGLWGAYLGAPAMWLLPVIFPVVMALGGALGVLGVPVPAVETCIALSGIMLGLAVAVAAKPPLWVAGVMVGFFAIFHGHAHGAEVPAAANAMTYSVGFVLATGLLHLSGIALGLLVRWPWGRVLVRAGGAVIALIGFGFLVKFLQPCSVIVRERDGCCRCSPVFSPCR